MLNPVFRILLLALLASQVASVQADVTKPADTKVVTVKGVFSVQPCTADVKDVVLLGRLPFGETSYDPFNVTVNCATPLQTEVYAQALGGLVTGTDDSMIMSGGDTGVTLSLKEGGQQIKLNGETDTFGSGFCTGTANRICKLTPVTQVSNSAREGIRKGAIRFNIRYKA